MTRRAIGCTRRVIEPAAMGVVCTGEGPEGASQPRRHGDAQGLPDGQGGQTPIAEQNVQMEFVYDAMGRRVEAVEYVSTYHREAHISLSLGAARVDGRCPDGFGSAKNALTGGWLHA